MTKYYFKCPRCENSESFVAANSYSTKTGCLVLLILGFIPYLFYSWLTNGFVKCLKCSKKFKKPLLPEPYVAKLAKLVFFLILMLDLAAAYLIAFPEFNQFRHQFSGFATIGLLITLNLLSLIFIVYALRKEHAFHRKLKAESKIALPFFS